MAKLKEELIPAEIIIRMTRETEKTKHVDSTFEPKAYITAKVIQKCEKKERT